jgi:hypothetical protein
MLPLLLALTMVAAGCTPARNPAPAAPTAGSDKPAETQPTQSSQMIPAENEICLKADDGSGVALNLGRPQSDGGYNARAGWTITWPATQILGHIRFGQPVDPASVKITVVSPDWVLVKSELGGTDARSVPLVVMPRERAEADPLIMQQGKAGWVTVKVEAANGSDGKPLLNAPASLRVFMFDNAMANSQAYLWQCLSTISNHAPNH